MEIFKNVRHFKVILDTKHFLMNGLDEAKFMLSICLSVLDKKLN